MEQYQAAILWLFLITLVSRVECVNEVLNPRISVAPPRPDCQLWPDQNGNCPPPQSWSLTDAKHSPPGWQCPCAPGPGGALANPAGVPITPNPDTVYFSDEVLVDGFNNPVALSFTDDTNALFVAERGGLVWKVDLSQTPPTKAQFLDLTAEVAFSGDRGIMDLRSFPTYSQSQKIAVMFAVKPEPPQTPPMDEPANQRLVTFAEVNGVADLNSRFTLFGAGEWDGVPICYNTHALGSLRFGVDGSLMVSTGEGSHWNFAMGDWGQNALQNILPSWWDGPQNTPSLDSLCAVRFGNQAIGAWRTQVHYSLGGKILRLDPTTGEGVCSDSTNANKFTTFNPHCDGSKGASISSKIWAVGMRNPFRMTMRPFNPSTDQAPGVFYFGDVGQGGYEEVNCVREANLNFGWPCWEGPLPMNNFRDSLFNDYPDTNYTEGCGGSGCGPIQYVATDPNGIRLTCPHVFQNYTTTMPFFFWSRYHLNDSFGNDGEDAFLGQGFYGATTAGLAFYSGTKYPPRYQNQIFALDYSNNWIIVLYGDNDIYDHAELFADLSANPTNKVTLEAGPDGDICYSGLGDGTIHRIIYTQSHLPPQVSIQVNYIWPEDDSIPDTVQFQSDGTSDRSNEILTYLWDFGDGTTSKLSNPLHKYSTPGTYSVNLTVADSVSNTTVSVEVYTAHRFPRVKITSPVPNLPNTLVYVRKEVDNVTFLAEAKAEGNVSFNWEYQFVHYYHYHPDIYQYHGQTFWDNDIPEEGTTERNNLRVYARVTDNLGLVAEDFVYLSRSDWVTAYGNLPPVPVFQFEGNLSVGQPIQFNAEASHDPNLDYLTYLWDWGDGLSGNYVITSHAFDCVAPNGFAVTLTVYDNWGAQATLTQTVNVLNGTVCANLPSTSSQPSLSSGNFTAIPTMEDTHFISLSGDTQVKQGLQSITTTPTTATDEKKSGGTSLTLGWILILLLLTVSWSY